MDDIYKNEKYFVKGVKINIFIQGNSDVFEQSKLRKAILEFHKEQDICLKFSEVIYQFGVEIKENKQEGDATMWTYTEHALSKIPRIYINNNPYIKDYNLRYLKQTLMHEFTHIWHYRTSEACRKMFVASSKLSSVIKKSMKEYKEEFFKFRESLNTNFFINLLFEGVARYTAAIKYDDTCLKQDSFDKQYKIAVRDASKVMKDITTYSASRNNDIVSTILSWFKNDYNSLLNDIDDASYTIGHHMVQAILFIDKRLTIEDVIQMNHLSFAKKYEACMNLIGKQPVVSLTSNKGILDYQKMLIKLYNVYAAHMGIKKKGL